MPTAEGYAKMHRQFLAQNAPKMLAELSRCGHLETYLREVGESALEMYDDLETQMRTAKTLPTDYNLRLAALQAIPVTVEELVLNDLVYALPTHDSGMDS